MKCPVSRIYAIESRSATIRRLTKCCKTVTLGAIRVAVRFFSGVPHPHLLGVCCPDFITDKSSPKLSQAKLDAAANFF